MSNCLKDYVGIRFCSDSNCESPGSGLFINSLPGLSVEVLDNVADSEQSSYLGVWNDAQDEAWQTFKIDFFNYLLDCYDVSRKCDIEQLICINKKILVNPWRYLLGVQLMLFRLYSPRLNFFTLDDKEAGELKDLYQTEYDGALSRSMKVLDMSTMQLPCNPKQIGTVTWLP